MKKKKSSFFSDGLSVDESKVSVLIISYIAVCAIVMYLCIANNETIVAKDVFIAILVGVSGINVTDKVTKNINKKNNIYYKNKDYNDTYDEDYNEDLEDGE